MKKHQGRRVGLYRQKPKLPIGSVQYLLESGTLADMRAAKQVTAALVKYQWDYYSELAHQRNAIQDEIKKAVVIGVLLS